MDDNSTDEKEVLDRFLEEYDARRARTSTLEAGLRDARETMKCGVALWLATVGYLIVVEHLGSSIALRSTHYSDRTRSEVAFKAGALEFSDGAIDEDTAEALYSLRCAIGHQYGLRNRKRHIFTLDQVGPLVVLPTVPWDGTAAGAQRSQTIVNVREVGLFVEKLVANARRDHQAGLVTLAPGKSADDLDSFGGLYS